LAKPQVVLLSLPTRITLSAAFGPLLAASFGFD